MKDELECLKNEAIELQKKIDNCNDYFFIYGWVRKLDEIKKQIEQLQDHVTTKDCQEIDETR